MASKPISSAIRATRALNTPGMAMGFASQACRRRRPGEVCKCDVSDAATGFYLTAYPQRGQTPRERQELTPLSRGSDPFWDGHLLPTQHPGIESQHLARSQHLPKNIAVGHGDVI